MATDAYSIGSNWTPSNPCFARFQLLSAAPSVGANGRSYFDTSLNEIGITVNGSWVYIGGGGGGGNITSVFGRTGVVTAQANDYTFAQLASKPTTLTGYGITDPIVLTSGSYSNPSWITGLAYSKLTGVPTTTQYMWVVGGANNFASLPGTPTAPIAGATTLVDAGLTGFIVRVYRNSQRQMGLNPANGNTYYTKTQGSNTLTFSSALSAGEEIIVETIPS